MCADLQCVRLWNRTGGSTPNSRLPTSNSQATGQFGSWELGILQRPETSQGPPPYCRFHPSMMSARVNPTTLSDSVAPPGVCLLYTSDAADERSSVDLGGR